MNRLSTLVPPPYRAPGFESGTAYEAFDATTMMQERLPFTVRVVSNEAELAKAVSIRAEAYGRHMPEFGAKLRIAEDTDTEPGVIVLLAEAKLDGSPLGTLRIQSNAYKPLKVEQSVSLPRWLRDRPLVEGSRLGIVSGSIGRLVKMVLIKATLKYCEQDGIDWAIVAARAPLDRQYDQMMFEDLFPEQGFIPMRHGNNIPHRVLGFEVDTGHQRLVEAKHPLLKFMCYTDHTDIDVRVNRESDLGELFPSAILPRATPPLGRHPV
ncbi:MAG: hypothetical protein ABJA49_01510 [Betaproteobacteria bacterium]